MCRAVLLAVCLLPACVQAGLHYSQETYADLPSRWRGFLLDQRALRLVAVRPTPDSPATVLRQRYEQDAARLGKIPAAKRTADEAADLGALLVRLGDTAKALEVLRPAFRAHPVHYRLAANLGTAWHLHGDLVQAAAALEQAVRLAPGKFVRAEELHLRLVRLRQRDRSATPPLDDLFGVRYVGPSGKYEAGILDVGQLKRLPSNAIAHVQQLALWLPADTRILWHLAELANAAGDVTTAAAIMDGCTGEFGLRSPDLHAHRKVVRAAADALAKKNPGVREEHNEHGLPFRPRSSRPLLSKFGLADLPSIDPRGVNTLGWEVVAETTVDRQARPTFPKYLRELDGKQVVIRGYVQPLGDDTDLGAFMLIEHPVGCWYCEMPEMMHIVLVEMPRGKHGRYTRDQVKVTGTLSLNASDPENFLYTIRDAKVSGGPSE